MQVAPITVGDEAVGVDATTRANHRIDLAWSRQFGDDGVPVRITTEYDIRLPLGRELAGDQAQIDRLLPATKLCGGVVRDRKEERIPVVMRCHHACLLAKQWSYPEDDKTSIGSEQDATVGQTPTVPATGAVGQQDCTHQYRMIAPAARCDENEGGTDIRRRMGRSTAHAPPSVGNPGPDACQRSGKSIMDELDSVLVLCPPTPSSAMNEALRAGSSRHTLALHWHIPPLTPWSGP
ncbi:MAG TPA: hypothetical protein VLA19_11390 [Herpetosiphonaceae bacterium]|nr:hypothetical protein [Herpetosiphonaceae bacterium]